MPAAEQSIEPGALSPKAGFRFTRRHYAAVFLVFAIVVFFSFQTFISERFECDSYAHFGMSPLQVAKLHLGGYRFVPAINMWLYALANVTDIEAQGLNTICLLACLALSMTILFLSLCKKSGPVSWSKLLLLAAAVTLFYVNPFVSAMALFPETGLFMGAGYLFVTLAAVFATRKISFANGLVSFVFLSAALGTYQSFIGFFSFAAFSLMFTEYRLSFDRAMLKRAAYLVSLLAVGSVANILIGKALCDLFGVAQNDRVAGFAAEGIVSNIKSIADWQSTFWNGLLHTTPRLLGFAVLAFLLLSVAAWFCVRSIRKIRAKELPVRAFIGNALFCAAAFLFCYASIFAPFLLASSVYLPARGVFSAFGMFLLLAAMLLYATESSPQHWAAAAAVGTLLFFCVLAITRMGVAQNMVNAIDAEYARQVTSQIASYERKTGMTVTKAAMINDSEPTYYYSSVEKYCAPYYVMVGSARVVSWSQVMLINYISGQDLERVPMPEGILAAHFEGKNWDFFVPSEQIFFDGDTVYIAAY